MRPEEYTIEELLKHEEKIIRIMAEYLRKELREYDRKKEREAHKK
jgi:hypothetical protein